ncbi:unnamed protein product [Dovyalis caffra]|uniref:CCAAT-binding factor domain-containing protein n=1 Tax=Dovyalis caffra TaxID=77055 RepID=A0AAV1SRS3_9ROSI|nr:unnamed protein product [Dovyalis caffra]
MVKEKSTQPLKDIELLKSEVASFASSLGLASSTSSSYSGFNDTDFRNPKPKPKPKQKQKDRKPPPPPPQNPQIDKKNSPKPQTFINKNDKSRKPISKPAPKPPILSLDGGEDDKNGNSTRKFDKYKNLPKLPLVKAGALGVWHVDLMELEKKVLGEAGKGKLEVKMRLGEWKGFVEKKRELGERLMWQYGKDYEQGRGQKGDIKMLVATQRSGTNADKVSAFSVLIGDNPVANLRSLDALLGMVTSKVGKRHALTGFEALKELFISSLLPDRKLKTLLQRPLNSVPETKDGNSLLLFWYWEDCLKQRYERFVFALEEASRDMLPALKDKALKTMYALLKSKSEQERRLLSALVNKLGDPQNKSASNADFHLSNLLSDHPNMKAVVIDEVDSFLFRPHLGLRSKYHAVNFLSQIRLGHRGDGPKVAKRLIDVYFALFKVLITEAGSSKKNDKNSKAERNTSGSSKETEMKSSPESHIELDSRLLSALLTGVNRAFPYVSSAEADDIIEVQTPTIFQLVHSKNFNVGIQALMLLDKISSKNQIVSDRFYRSLYSKLLLPAVMNSSKASILCSLRGDDAEMFIGLLLRAMKSDVNLKRVAAFSKRLLQVALQQPPQYSCGCLFLLSEVLKARPPLWNMVLQSELVDEDLEHFEDILEETDNEPSTTHKKEEIGLDLVGNGDKTNSESDSAEEEDYSPASSSEDDVSDEEEELLIEDSSKELQELQPPSDCNGNQPQINSTGPSLPGGYDPRHREPSYCNADRASWWELMVLASHAHPSVATMAGTLLSGANIVYNGNPLNDLSLTSFLDKFMEKKPKQTAWHGGSQIEPAKKLDMNTHLIGSEILSLAEVDVPPEDLVFHKFYVNKMNTSKPKKKKKKKAAEEAAEDLFDVGDGDDEVVGDDESDNEEIDDLLDSANLTLEAENEYDYDDLDQIVDEDDDDLVRNVDDAEEDATTDGEDFDTIVDSDDDAVDVGDADDGTDEDGFDQRKRKRKSKGKPGASPFASLEDYEHMLNEDSSKINKSEKRKSKSRKKRKSSE